MKKAGGVSLPPRCPHPAALPKPQNPVAVFSCPRMSSVDHARVLRASFAFVRESEAQGSGAEPWNMHPFAALALGTFRAAPWLREVAVRGPVPAIALQQAVVWRVAYYAPVVAKRRKLQQRLLDCVGDDWRAVALHKCGCRLSSAICRHRMWGATCFAFTTAPRSWCPSRASWTTSLPTRPLPR